MSEATTKPMAKLPSFKDASNYEIKVGREVTFGTDLKARPSSHRIVVTGEVAKSLGDAVIWAKEV